jgi:hypothetical protein
MSRTRPFQFVLGYAITIINHANQPQATAAYLNAYLVRPRVKRILYQFFHDRDRSLNHFARRDPFRHVMGQALNWLPRISCNH